MPDTGTCPYCGKRIANLKIEPIGNYEGVGNKYSGITLLCPGCKNLLQAEIHYHQLNG